VLKQLSMNLRHAARLVLPHGIVVARDLLKTRRWQSEQRTIHAARHARIRGTSEAHQPSEKQPRFDYSEAITFLAGVGCDPDTVRAGSMSEPDLIYSVNHLVSLIPSPPWMGMHIGNFVGISLAFFVYEACRLDRRSLVVAIDPNLPHRGITNPTAKAVALLNHFGLQRNVVSVNGYSIEKCVSNDGLVFAQYDPAEYYDSEQSFENVLQSVKCVAPARFDYCVTDGNHEADYVRRELVEIYDLLKPGGTVVLDDVSWQWPELMEVYESVDSRMYRRIAASGRVGVLQKR
jgi:hypothetical protein